MSLQDLERPARQRLLNIAIVGATGAVGAELIGCLERRGFPVGQLKLLASARSAGRTLVFKGQPVAVETLTAEAFDGVDIALFSAGAAISRQFAPLAAARAASWSTIPRPSAWMRARLWWCRRSMAACWPAAR